MSEKRPPTASFMVQAAIAMASMPVPRLLEGEPWGPPPRRKATTPERAAKRGRNKRARKARRRNR